MFRPAVLVLSLLLALGWQVAQAQFIPSAPLVPSGPPASVLSPTADGRVHGPPASVLSLKPVPPGVHVPGRAFFSTVPQRPFHNFDTLHHRRHVLVPVPLFYPAYGPGDYAYPSIADPNVTQADPAQPGDDAASASNEDALREAYLQGARDAMRRELEAAQAKAPPRPPNPAPKTIPDEAKAPAEPDDSPATVFIFKDGHQIETRNYAIMGQTLYDLSGPSLKKVQLNDLDSAATLKANDDRGVQVKLP